jgi:putative FmdB family regulatory protein
MEQMPTYQYRCDDCAHSFEQFQKFSDDALTVCPDCGGTIRRVIGPVGVVFKGSGWYINDSRPKSGDSATLPPAAAKSTDGEKAADSAKPTTDAPAKSVAAESKAPASSTGADAKASKTPASTAS